MCHYERDDNGTNTSRRYARPARHAPTSVPLGEAFAPYVWIDDLGNHEKFEAQVEIDSGVARIERLNGTVDRHLYRIEWNTGTEADDGFLAALRAHDREVLAGFKQACSDAGISIEIRRTMHNPTAHDESFGLTAKQHEALVLEFDEGYFRVPIEITLTGLSEKRDLSRQAYTRQLQRALRNYLTSTGIDELNR